jgi:hypothetical protein
MTHRRRVRAKRFGDPLLYREAVAYHSRAVALRVPPETDIARRNLHKYPRCHLDVLLNSSYNNPIKYSFFKASMLAAAKGLSHAGSAIQGKDGD